MLRSRSGSGGGDRAPDDGRGVDGVDGDGDRSDVQFSGDLSDPWVRALRSAMPPGTVDLDGSELPEGWEASDPPRVLVLHRATLGALEADRLREARQGGQGPRVVLVVGRHARYHQVMGWSGLVDAVLPEATARETIARHLGLVGDRAPGGGGRRIAVASGQLDLALMLEDVLAGAGYRPTRRAEGPSGGDEPWVVWDVPVLEPDWSDRLAAAAQGRGVVALLGLADRDRVSTARRSGALACLDLPVDPDDLVFVLDRLTSGPSARSGSLRRRRAHGPHRHRARPEGVPNPVLEGKPKG
ncbi:ANTAR domain-containing protein [Tautonia sociabilis]|uniref:Uncharacterized protein n=1 Tax=Tautonia sociabilis TaxID=2080755 RepID=A0A432MLB9_9BACT|nr:hypothetical protein [Tautonia sociabilis]RUL88059.1 hypothetical protein TsocGM_08945 [Tautonia sociabilis]